MKKTIILILIFLFVVSGFAFSGNQKTKAENTGKKSSFSNAVTKTYFLAHVSPQVVHRTLRQYFWECSYDKNANMFTVRINRENIPTFEKMLKKLDVEKKKILVRIFTVIASRENKAGKIENKDLKEVLDELKNLLSFKSFLLDGVSALTVTEGQDDSNLLLASQSPLKLMLEDIYIRGEKQGQRTVEFEFRLKQKTRSNFADTGQYDYQTLIESRTSVKENGYLVAGVSKIGNGDSLVLVINAQIK